MTKIRKPGNFKKRMEPKTGLDQFLEILTKPDNVPIAAMLLLILFFTWIAFREARKNDQLIEEGKEDEVLKEMQE